ncbi:MAG: hypothetical protein M3410_08055 [Acidobacteriota bacterium]|nr:hypothetical protein [Acidobacteriota bacterium]
MSNTKERVPLQQKLFSAEQLESHATVIAKGHKLSITPPLRKLLIKRHKENCHILQRACNVMQITGVGTLTTPQYAECLLNNYDFIEEHLQMISEALRRPDLRELPSLCGGSLAGLPRIFGIALTLTAFTNSCFDEEAIQRFVQAYQRTALLLIRELRTLQLALRFALIEHLCTVICGNLDSQVKISNAILPQFVNRLPPKLKSSPAAESSLSGERLSYQQIGIKNDFHLDQESQNMLGHTVEDIISSLHLLPNIDWRALFNSLSLVDLTLRQDPTGVYSLMDKETLDHYRLVIQRIAKRTKLTEVDIARHTVEAASEVKRIFPNDQRRAHVGYYLVGEGRHELEQSVEYSPIWRERITRAIRWHSTAYYFTLLFLIASTVQAVPLTYAVHAGASLLTLAWLTVLLLVPATSIAVQALHLSPIVEPSLLPKMDFSRGVVEEAQTMVVIPAILSSKATVEQLIERLETHYLATQDRNIYFALLGDWSDAPQELMPSDETLLHEATSGIKQLNEWYRGGPRDRFHLFHRRRQWNPSQRAWIGWERKRGKLHEFNRLLRGARDTSFITCTADADLLARTRYVLTLDSDTELLRDAARRLVGTIHHPLNQPQIDTSSGRIDRGYGVIQPRIFFANSKAERSKLPKIISILANNDSHGTAIFDLYQDLFGEGVYIGKGLYDVDAFEGALKGRIPDNSILSHDIYEGLHAHAAQATDILLSEGQSLDYMAGLKTLHRWTRGDWQLLPWIFPHVPDEHGAVVPNVLPSFSRWRIMNLLWQSLLLPTILLWLLASWIVLPGSSAFWTLCALLYFALSMFLMVVLRYLKQPRGLSPVGNHVTSWHDFKLNARVTYGAIKTILFSIIFLAQGAYIVIDAISRTIYRVYVSRKNLLDWTTTAQTETEGNNTVHNVFRFVWPALLIALACSVLVHIIRPGALKVAAPCLIFWLLSPLIAFCLTSKQEEQSVLQKRQTERAFRLRARRVWTSLTDDHKHQLSRTTDKGESTFGEPLSPKRLARHLLWTTAARDLGAVGILDLGKRIGLTLSILETHQQSSSSSIKQGGSKSRDSAEPLFLYLEIGNLSAYLNSFKPLVSEIVEQPLLGERVLQGLLDTTFLIKQEANRVTLKLVRREKHVSVTEWVALLQEQATILKEIRQDIEYCSILAHETGGKARKLTEWHELLKHLERCGAKIKSKLHQLQLQSNVSNISELSSWVDCLIDQTREFNHDLSVAAPLLRVCPVDLEAITKECDAVNIRRWSYIKEALNDVQAVMRIPGHYRLVLLELTALRREMELSRQAGNNEPTPASNAIIALMSNVEETIETFDSFVLRLTNLAERSEPLLKFTDYHTLFDLEYYSEVETLRT